MELLNPNFAAAASSSSSSSQQQQGGSHDDFDEEMEASPKAKLFSQIRPDDYSANMEFLMKNPEIVTERETDGLLALAFNAALEGKNDRCRQCVHQALLLQYCRLLGRDGVAVFFKRMNTKGHQARDLFFKDVQDMYGRIVTRTREIVAQRAKEPEEVAQIQLHAVEPGTEIKINIPAADAETVEGKEARMIFESFSPDFRKALESGSLDEVNKVLGEMKVEEAEEVVGKLSEVRVPSPFICSRSIPGEQNAKDQRSTLGRHLEHGGADHRRDYGGRTKGPEGEGGSRGEHRVGICPGSRVRTVMVEDRG